MKAKSPSKPQFSFITTILVTKDVMPMFVGLGFFRAAFIQHPAQKDMSFLIFSLSSFQHHPSLLASNLSMDLDASQNKYRSSRTSSSVTTAQIKHLTESSQVTAGHCQRVV